MACEDARSVVEDGIAAATLGSLLHSVIKP
jgi:hypothetical protein